MLYEAGHQFHEKGKKAVDSTRENISNVKSRFQRERITDPLKKEINVCSYRSSKGTVKTVGHSKKAAKSARRSVKTAEKTAKTTIKTSQQTAKAAQRTAQTASRASHRAAQAARVAAKATVTALKAAVRAAVSGRFPAWRSASRRLGGRRC